ncbi:MAG: endonuclease/exonuclease/phosphatase family protein [Nocardioides sp.]
MPPVTLDRARHRHENRRWPTFALITALAATVVGIGVATEAATGPDQTPATQAPVSADPGARTMSRASSEVLVRRARAEKNRLPKFRVVKGTSLRRFNAEEKADLLQAEAAKQPVSFRIGTFNVLGSQHTVPGGPRSRQYPPASVRNGGAVSLIRDHGVDVLGTQELQADQLGALQSATGMAAFPGYQFGERETDNSILYDDSIFEFVSGDSFTIHFMRADRPQTILRLRHRATGREMYFLNMHASAGEGQYAVTRRAGHYTAIDAVNRLKAEGLPVFLTGDMNDRAEFFCRVAPATGLVASIGGSTAGGCSPAGALAVDWVLGTGGVGFEDYREDRSTLGRISDHHFVSSTANIAPDTTS